MNKVDQIIAEARDSIQAWQAVHQNAPIALEDAAMDAIIANAIKKVLAEIRIEEKQYDEAWGRRGNKDYVIISSPSSP